MEYCSSAEDFSSCDSDASCTSERQQRGLFMKDFNQGNGELHQEYSHHACHGYGREFPVSCAEDRDPHGEMHNRERGRDRDLHRDRDYGHHMDHEIGHNYSTEHGNRHNYHSRHERVHNRYMPYERRHGCHMFHERRHNHHLHHERGHDHHLHHERGHDHHLHHERGYGHHLHHGRDHSHHLHHERGHDHHSHNENRQREHGHHLHNERELNHPMSNEREHGYFKHHHDSSADQQKQGAILHDMRYKRKFLAPLLHNRRYDHHMRCKMGYRRNRFPSFIDRKVCSRRNLNCGGATEVYEPKSKVKVTNENTKFQICLDTSHYQPEEVKMKIVNDKIEICALHESVGDGVYEFHEMFRSFTLPAGIDSKNVSSRLAPGGNFIVEASINSNNEVEAENDVPVVQSND